MESNVSPELKLLADFTVKTSWDDLPEKVVHETKRLLLDSVGCAFTGLSVDPGKMITVLARRMGGPPEASILGTGNKVSSYAAVLANGQLINATDFDAFVGMGHGAPYLIPAPLAVAEKRGVSGKELIVATAIACEIAKRVKKAVRPDRSFMLTREGYANMNFGAAAAAGKLLNLDQQKMMHALSTAGHASQVLTWSHLRSSKRGYYPKYGHPGWQGTGALMAVELAEMGYVGDMNVFDPEHGFWKFAGYAEWAPQHITEALGETWTFVETDPHDPMAVTYKPRICCKIFSAAVDGIYEIMAQNNLAPEDIDDIKVFTPLGPLNWIGMFRNTTIENIVDAQFSVPFNLALAAYNIPGGVEWQDTNMMKDPRITSFMKKVEVFEGYPEWDAISGMRNRIEIQAKGQTFVEDRKEAKGGSLSKATDADLTEKFSYNASRILTGEKVDKAIKALWDLESLADVNELMEQVTM